MPHRLHYRKPLTSLSTYIKFCSRTLAVDDQSEETVPRLKSVWSLVRNALGEPLPAYQELTIAGDRCRSGEDFDSEVEENIDELDENLVRCPSKGRERGYHEAEPNDGINRLKTRMTNAHSPSSKEVDLKHQLPGLLRPPVGDLWDSVEVEEVAKHGTLPTSKDKDQVAHKLTTSASRGSTLYRGSLTPLPSCIPPTPLNHYRPHDYVFRKYLDDQHGIRYAYAARFSRSMKKLEFHKHGDHKWSHNDLSRVDDFINFWASRDLKVSARAGGKKKESGTAWRGKNDSLTAPTNHATVGDVEDSSYIRGQTPEVDSDDGTTDISTLESEDAVINKSTNDPISSNKPDNQLTAEIRAPLWIRAMDADLKGDYATADKLFQVIRNLRTI
ncbi:hypothetical protein MJO28_002781 [Puccinia striiformis f. sp. tritici]|uniref:Uncharacterized protein n=1 Tax=Puccinia striiformis f. sp. tritici TaxID=168172 RepID=A0ACC0EQW2_9BASI|nr:hypothetical protein MJO28_002781 [Puccinia striiformis f. sp. tritici]